MRRGTDQKSAIAAIKGFSHGLPSYTFFWSENSKGSLLTGGDHARKRWLDTPEGSNEVLVTSPARIHLSPEMPKPSKARRAALEREEARRLEREVNLENPSVTEHHTAETRPWGSSRTSKWRDKNGKTKRSRAVRMQPSVLKFFSVSNRGASNILVCLTI